MKYNSKQYARALHEALNSTKDSEHDKVLDNFVSALKENNDLHLAREIEVEFLNRDREAKGVKLAEVSTAKPLSGAEEERIIKELNDYVGGKVELKKKVDAGQLGGIVVKIGDELIDGSTKKSLEELKNKLIS